jgi:hypothetical protein
VYPQLKSSFFANEGQDKDCGMGEEILALACNQIEGKVYAAGNNRQIFIVKVEKNASFRYAGVLKVPIAHPGTHRLSQHSHPRSQRALLSLR